MTTDDVLGRDLTTALSLLHGQFKRAQEVASMDNVARVLERTQLSDYRPTQELRGLERCTEALQEFRRILFYRVLLMDPSHESEKLAEVCATIHDVLAQENDPAVPQPLPRIDARTLDPEKFYKEHILRPQAVMLDNWGFDPAPLQLETLVQKFGDEPQPLLRIPEIEQYEGPFRDIQNSVAYLANSDRLLNRHPELLDGLNAGRFQKLGKLAYMSSQLFAGNCYAGSPAHFAATPNLFYMIEGSKKWTLVDPAFSYLTYVHLNPIDGYSALYWMDENDAERCPLFRFCPRYEVTLTPGDLLFNPRYWPHSVVNLTQKAVGVAVRWMEQPNPEQLSPCALLDVARQLNPRRIEIEIGFLLAVIADRQDGWFEGNVHARTYRYSPDDLARAWGVQPADYLQPPRFRDFAPEAQKLPLRPT